MSNDLSYGFFFEVSCCLRVEIWSDVECGVWVRVIEMIERGLGL